MSFLTEWLDPGRRFERQYAEHLITRYQAVPWPGGTRVDLQHEFVPVRGLDSALARHSRLILTGGAGEGKTTALAQLALAHAQALLAGKRAALVPILISGHDLVSDRLPSAADMNHVIPLSDTLMAQCPDRFFSDALAARRALVLIDDVDALPAAAAGAWLDTFCGARVVATAQRAYLADWPKMALPGFRDGDVTAFAKAWSVDKAREFEAAVKAGRVPRALTCNPLTLTLLTRVWRASEPLPANRTALFDAYARQVLREADESARMLEGVALGTLQGTPALNGFLAKSHGFLRAGKNRKAEFIHDLWQAYFAARALHQSPEQLADVLSNPSWEEAIAFYAGLGDGAECVAQLVARGEWTLAGRALAHAGPVPAALREAATDQVVRRAWEGDPRAEAALSEMDSDAVVRGLAVRLKDTDPAVRRRAAQLLGTLRLDRGIEHLLPQLRDPDGDVRDAVVAALGMARTDRVIEPLLVALRGDPRAGHSDTRLRAAAARALGETGSDRAVTALIVDLQVGEPELRAAAAESLKRIASPLMFKPLAGLVAAGDEESRRYAAEILSLKS